MAVQEESAVELETAVSAPLPTLSYMQLRDVIDLALWAGQLMLQSGATSARAEETVHHIGTGLGCSWLDVIITPDALTITAISEPEFRTKTRRLARFGGVNKSTVAAISDLSYRVSSGQLDRHALRAALRQLDKQPRHYPLWLTAIMVGLACAAFSRLFGGDWLVFGVTQVAATAALLVRHYLTHNHFNLLLVITTSAMVAGSIAGLGVRLGWGERPSIALAASVLLLVPGVPLINALDDILRGHTLTGIARGVMGALISLGIAAGLAIAIRFMGLPDPLPPLSPLPTIWQDMLWAGVAALGFAILFNVPPKLLLFCALCGAAGHGVRYLLLGYLSWGIELATLVGAVIVGFLAYGFAVWQKVPSSTFAVSGVIPMVPGTFAFGTMLGILQVAEIIVLSGQAEINLLLVETNVAAIKTAFILIALSLGIALPKLLFIRPKPVV